jgi:hypothetical protein
LNLLEVLVRPVNRVEEPRFQHLMQQHHYLGALPKISETLWYVATLADQWLALLSFSTEKKTGESSSEIAYGITSRTPEQADPQRLLATNRGHWCLVFDYLRMTENSCAAAFPN